MADQQQHREEQYHRIERYLNGLMSPAEVEAFELDLQSDRSLREEFELHRDLHSTLGDEEERTFRRKLQLTSGQWHQQQTRATSRSSRPVWAIISIAAMLLIVFGIFTWFNKEQTDGDLFAENFQPYTMILNERAAPGSDESSRKLREAIKHYTAGEFEEAAAAFQQLRRDGMNEVSIRFYEGVSLLASDQPAEAAGMFRDLKEEDGHLLNEQSTWYLGLALWKDGRKKEALEIFQSIQPGEYQYQQASDFVKK